MRVSRLRCSPKRFRAEPCRQSEPSPRFAPTRRSKKWRRRSAAGVLFRRTGSLTKSGSVPGRFLFAARARGCGNLDAISPGVFRTIKCLVGEVHHLFEGGFLCGWFSHSDADRHTDIAGWSRRIRFSTGTLFLCRCTPVGPARYRSAVASAQAKAGLFDLNTQIFEIWHHLSNRLSREQDREFLATDAIGLPTSGHVRQFRSDQGEDLIPSIVTVGVIDTFKVVDVDSRQSIGSL